MEPVTPHCDKCELNKKVHGEIHLNTHNSAEEVERYNVCEACYNEIRDLVK